MSDKREIKVEFDFVWAILILFWVFWWQSGWYRIDCALGITRACDLIAAEKDYTKGAAPDTKDSVK